MAKKNRWVVDNPFNFSLNKKRYGGVQQRDAVSRADMRKFLDFVRTDRHFQKYFNGIFILFNTGLRISEFCGLIPEDIDFTEHTSSYRVGINNFNNENIRYFMIPIPIRTSTGTVLNIE